MTEPQPAVPTTRRDPKLRALCLLLALAGAAIAILLVQEHLAVFGGELAAGPFCGGSARFDCGRVAAHESSWMLGLPLALWGLLCYAALAGLAALGLASDAAERAAADTAAAVLATMMVVVDGWLAWVMFAQIGAWCALCLATYGVNLLLAIVSWILFTRRTSEPSWHAALLRWGVAKVAIAVVTVAAMAVAFVAVARPVSDIRHDARVEAIQLLSAMNGPAEVDMARFAGLSARGPENAPVTIVVSGDFQCSFCRALETTLERLRHDHPDQLRVLFLDAPLSPGCNPAITEDLHPDACWLALVGRCAEEQGLFWRYHDFLFRQVPFAYVERRVVEPVLSDMGLDTTRVRASLDAGAAATALAREVALARELQLTKTPSIVINGHAMRGGVYPSSLRMIVKALLRS